MCRSFRGVGRRYGAVKRHRDYFLGTPTQARPTDFDSKHITLLVYIRSDRGTYIAVCPKCNHKIILKLHVCAGCGGSRQTCASVEKG